MRSAHKRRLAIPYDWKTEVPGVFSRHDDGCPVRNGQPCTCGPLGYRSSVRDPETNRRILSPQFRQISEAQAWQADQTSAQQAVRTVSLQGGELGEVIDGFLRAVEEGRAVDRWGVLIPREALRDLRGALSYVDAELGLLNVGDVRRRHVQGLVDQLVAAGLPTARLYAVVDALEALYAYAIEQEVVGFSPVVGLALSGAQDLQASPAVEHAASNGRPSAASIEVPQSGIYAAAPVAQGPYETPTGSFGSLQPGQAAAQFDTPPPPVYPPTREQPRPAYATPSPWRYAPPPPGFDTPMPPSTSTTRLSQAIIPPGFGPPQYDPQSGQFANPAEYQAHYDATMQERFLWWTVRIVVVVFVLIALVLAAESV